MIYKNVCKYGLLLIIMYSCSDKNVNNEQLLIGDLNLERHLELGDTLHISVPDEITNITALMKPFFTFNDTYFAYQGEQNNGQIPIHRYSYDESSWETIQLETSGPNQVYGAGGFGWLSDSVMYYLSTIDARIILLDEQGAKTDEFVFSDNRMVSYNSAVKSPFIFIDDEHNLYFDITQYKSLTEESTFEQANLIGVLDTLNKTFRSIVPYPPEFHGKTWSTNDVGRKSFIVDEHIYMSFSKSKYIYKYDMTGNLVDQSIVGTRGIKDAQGRKNDDPYQHALNQLKNGHYVTIIYDKWNELFYRIGTYLDTSLDFSLDKPETMSEAFRSQKIAITAFDKELKIIAHNVFPTQETGLNHAYYFVNKNGLYLYQSIRDKKEESLPFRKVRLK